jgi:hypothetical protein
MSRFARSRRAAVAVVATAVTAGIALPASASAVTFTNACKNNAAPANNDQVTVGMTATSPAAVPPGALFGLTNINQTLAVPGSVFVAGYNLGLLTAGPNTIPTDVHSVIDAPNTVQAQQTTNTVSGSISTTITDPDGMPGSGDETATDGSISVTYADETWTAGASGTINFREHTDTAITGASGGGIVAVAHLSGGAINVQFHCSPGTVTGPSLVITFTDPAVAFASSLISTSAPVPPTPPGPPPPAAPVVRISSARLSSTVFRAASRGASLTSRRPPIGTDVRYRVSMAAKTTFAVLRPVTGHKRGNKCVAGRPRTGQKRCTRYVPVGSFTHQDRAGNVKVHFSGRVRGRKLSPGRYRLTLTPKANDKTGKTVTLSFRIVR